MKLKVLLLGVVAALVGQFGLAQAIPDADKAIADGAKWLVSQQKENGCFSQEQFPGLTGLALWALISTGDEAYKPNIDKAVEFLKTKGIIVHCFRDHLRISAGRNHENMEVAALIDEFLGGVN